MKIINSSTNKFVGIVLALFVIFSVVYAAGFHSPGEIMKGTFIGNYSFNGELNMKNATIQDNYPRVQKSGVLSFSTDKVNTSKVYSNVHLNFPVINPEVTCSVDNPNTIWTSAPGWVTSDSWQRVECQNDRSEWHGHYPSINLAGQASLHQRVNIQTNLWIKQGDLEWSMWRRAYNGGDDTSFYLSDGYGNEEYSSNYESTGWRYTSLSLPYKEQKLPDWIALTAACNDAGGSARCMVIDDSDPNVNFTGDVAAMHDDLTVELDEDMKGLLTLSSNGGDIKPSRINISVLDENGTWHRDVYSDDGDIGYQQINLTSYLSEGENIIRVYSPTPGEVSYSFTSTVENISLGSLSNPGNDCRHIHENVPSAGTGTYWINPDGGTPFKAYCDMVTDGGGWTLVYKVSENTNQDPVNLWERSSPYNQDNGEVLDLESNKENYVNRIVTSSWNSNGYSIDEVRTNVYEQEKAVAWIQFDGSGSSRSDWFSESNVLGSSWTDLTSEAKNYFGISGNAGNERHWYINRNHNGCASDTGWLTLGFTEGGCVWDTYNSPGNSIIYSDKNTYETWQGDRRDIRQGDMFAVFVR